MEVRPGYKQTEAGVIPEEWESNSLEKCLETQPAYGIGAPAVPDRADLPRYLRITDISDDGKFHPNPPSSVNHALSGRYLLKEGDITIARTGASTGKSYLYSKQDGNLVYAGFLIKISPNKETLSPAFLANYLKTQKYWKWIKQTSMRSGQPGISGRQLSLLQVPLPSIVEQRAIATALSDMDALLESLNVLIAKKRAIKQATVQQLLSGKIRLPEHQDRWQLQRLGDLATMSSGGTPPSSNPEYYDGDIPWVSISDMTKGGKFISKTDRNLTALGLQNSAAKIFPKNTVLYSMYASLGECSIANIPTSTSQAILGIQTGDSLLSEFLYHYLNYIKPTIASLGQQGTQNNLNKGMVQDLIIPTPHMKEQEKISKIIDEMDYEIETLDQLKVKNTNLKQAMMQELLTGRIRLIQ